MNTKGVSPFVGVIVGSKTILDDGRYEEVKTKYHNPEFVAKFEKNVYDHRRAIELGRLTKLMDCMCEAGAKPEEFSRVVLYAYICIDALKYELNYSQARNDLKISELYNNYMGYDKKEETK